MVNFRRKFWILINRTIFKLKGIKFGRDLRVYDRIYVKLKGNNTIKIGNNFAFSSGGNYNPLARNIRGSIELEQNASLIIGNNVGVSSICLRVYSSCSIGNNVKIGADTIILDSDAHSLNYLNRRNGSLDRPNAHRKPITIEDDVLIGMRCIILKGVTIGAKTIIGSGSVVTKSIPSDCIAAGNPCKVIKYLNNE